LFDQFIQSLK